MRRPTASAKLNAVDADQQIGRAFSEIYFPETSRRKFLQFVAAAGAGAILTTEGLLAQANSSAVASGRVDVHHHLLPPFYVKAREKEIAASGRPIPSWTPQKSIESMDKNGIATAMLSPLGHLVEDSLSEKTEQSRDFARQSNEYGAQLVRDYRGRFGLLAALPFPDQDSTLKEIAYAFDTLKADGVAIWTSYRDKWPGDPDFAPAFEELNRRKAVVFIHPAASTCCRKLIPGVTENVVEYDFDTTRAVTSLLTNGAFGRYPDIRFIISHSGGTMPVLANRISEYYPPKTGEYAKDGVREELKHLYYEVAHATYSEPLSALTKLVPSSQILFGSDFPIVQFPTTATGLDQFGFSAADLHAINRGNAERLFPRLKA